MISLTSKLAKFSLASLLLASLFVGPAQAIKKCQDANGKWHYGDTSVDACAESKVTTLTDRGFVADEEAAPKTEEELKAEAEEAQRLAQEEAEKLAIEEEKQRILSIYETEADIDRQRDNQIRSVQSNIDVHESYLSNMEVRLARYEKQLAAADHPKTKEKIEKQIAASQTRVEDYSAQLKELQEQKSQIMARFEKERETYIALKKEQEG